MLKNNVKIDKFEYIIKYTIRQRITNFSIFFEWKIECLSTPKYRCP